MLFWITAGQVSVRAVFAAAGRESWPFLSTVDNFSREALHEEFLVR
jgi:hypothetical protein